MKVITIAMLLICCAAASLAAKTTPEVKTRIYNTRRINSEVPEMDGKLDEAIWDTVEWSGDFIQRVPSDGEPPSHQSKFKVLYDDEAVYFAFRCYDDPEKVTRILARRDWFPGDWIEVNIDSYFDHRTAFSFTLSVSGTRGDEFVSNDGDDWNSNWDPIWHGAAKIDEEGWTAEMKIPLSQLRFSGAEEQTWGLQVQRRLFRKEERSTWQCIPKETSGWVSRFGELRGIHGIRPRRHIEIMPYGVAKTENFETVEGDPFLDGSTSALAGGLDGKIGVTNNLTLDFTINPDFGQVEADPSEVNLTAFETFFSEKRPFFIEGNNILDLPLCPAITGGSFTSDRLFYSRRIGHYPTHYPDLEDDESIEQPDNTSIIGAFKLTGKTSSGLSIGIMESLTAKEKAEIDHHGERRFETVEPLTNYFVGRIQQDFRDGNTYVGAMMTAVNRDIEDSHLEFMRRQAYAGGIDFSHYFLNRDYRIEANLLASHLRGSEEAIYEAQTASARYFQRPDNYHVTLDESRTTLSGHSGSVRLRRTSNHKFVFQTGAAWRSPGFEINDLGYMRRADEINQFTWAAYQIRNPFSIFNNLYINTNQWLNWDFGGSPLWSAANANFNTTFRNYYQLGGGITHSWEEISNFELRGGPSFKWPGSTECSLWMYTDTRKKFYAGWGGYTKQGDEDYTNYTSSWAEMFYRPTNALRLSFSTTYVRNKPEMQYVATESFAGDDRYLFGRLDQKTASFVFRIDYCITPNLTVQYYGSPFVSAGEYTEFKRITDPRADNYRDRFEVFDDEQIRYDAADETYYIDEDVNGIDDYSMDYPDFNYRDFNSNLVIRWEFTPGSLLYLVWTQARTDYISMGSFRYGNDMDALFDVHPHDVFLVKVVKWFSL
jgi:hypothetical protein